MKDSHHDRKEKTAPTGTIRGHDPELVHSVDGIEVPDNLLRWKIGKHWEVKLLWYVYGLSGLGP